MTHRDFCFWLQGHLELGGYHGMGPDQVEIVRQHLDLVFRKETEGLVGKPHSWGEIAPFRALGSDVPASC